MAADESHAFATHPVLSIRSLHKRFGSNDVLRNLSLDVGRGEVLGLMGPNGAGKSTLIRILDGIEHADAGDIVLHGSAIENLRGHSSVGMVHQDLGLVDTLSIADNLRLGQPPIRRVGPVLDLGEERRLARLALDYVGLDRDVTTPVGDLSPGEKALVALARLRQRGASIVIVDEVTSTLPPADASVFIQSLRAIANAGGTVILVTHKLSEILDAADRVVLMIDGQIVADQLRSELNRSDLVELILEHDAVWQHDPIESTPGEVMLTLDNATSATCGPVDLQLRAGEVLGLTGVAGSGLHEVALLAAGAVPLTGGSRSAESEAAIVPPSREVEGGFGDLSSLQNLTISTLRRFRHRTRVIEIANERRAAEKWIQRLRIKPNDPDASFGTLSGGNKQKVIFGRALMTGRQIIVLCEPTRGVDLTTRFELYQLIRETAASGAAILVTSSDAEDLFAVCDRVGVVAKRKIASLSAIDDLADEQIEALL